MQFDRAPDGTLSPLPAPCVDTGMGLERLAAVLQHVHSNYEIDLFAHLIKVASELTSTADLANKSLRVIADHIRACSFLIVDGVLPSNEGRGYVLRRIIRRALRHGWMLGVRGDFFWKMVRPLVEEMGEAYPELVAKQAFVEEALRTEEKRFGETLENGMRLFDTVAAKADKTIPGADAFRLYDTYGFPVDLTADIARERGMSVDMAGFELAMKEQQERSREGGRFEAKGQMPAELASQLAPTAFLGYEALAGEGKVIGIVRAGKQRRSAERWRRGPGHPRPHAVLRRIRRSGGRHRHAGERRRSLRRRATRSRSRGAFYGHVGRWHGTAAARRRCRRGNRRSGASPGHRAQSFGHASAARRTAQGAGRARHAEGLASRAGSSALRFLAFQAASARTNCARSKHS